MNTKAHQLQQKKLWLNTIITISIVMLIVIIVTISNKAATYADLHQNIEDQFQSSALITDRAQYSAMLKHSQPYNHHTEIQNKRSNIVKPNSSIHTIYELRKNKRNNYTYSVFYTKRSNFFEPVKTNSISHNVIKNASHTLKQEFIALKIQKTEKNQSIRQWSNWLLLYMPHRQAGYQTLGGVIEITNNKNASISSLETNMLLLLIVAILLLIPIVAIIVWIFIRRLTTPILNMTKSVLNISIDNLNQRIATSDNKEINQLSQAINNMLIKINASLSEVQEELAEQTIKLQERTQELEKITKRAEKQANEIKVLAFIARATLSISNLDILLLRIATTLSETLSFYHVGIFLLDDAKQYAILTATNSIGGQKMIERNHHVTVGDGGVVGYVAGIARPRIAVKTDKNGILLTEADLSETYSELAVPLKIGLDIIGVLDVHSKESYTFTQEDIEIFTIFADYISIAIQNTRRLHEIQKNITESDTLYRNYLRQEWKSFANQRRNPGYLYNISGSKPITRKLESIEIQKAIQSGKPTISQEKAQSHLSVPIKLRDQVIGILNIQSGNNYDWKEDEIDIATAVADRVGLAVENARLLEDLELRAARERTIGEITSKISASINIRNVLQTAVEELGHILPGSDVIIQLKDTKNKEL